MKVGFVVGTFPVVSETYIIDQVADLMDRGVDIEIFAFHEGDGRHVSQKYVDYRMADKVHYLDFPENKIKRAWASIPRIVRMCRSPHALSRVFSRTHYGKDALSLKMLFWASPFVGREVDMYHCHFGTIAERFAILREVLGIKKRFITTFYGQDASKVLNNHPNPYPRLKKESSLILCMSEDMKQRLIGHGFDPERVKVHPVSINTANYPFKIREPHSGPAQIISVGRMVEKKGFSDLLNALAIVKNTEGVSFHCTLIGDGPLMPTLKSQASQLKLDNNLSFQGAQSVEEIIEAFETKDFFVQPSKTAPDGDME